ncbi:hypothetical protein TTHERM_00185510 (macronuclear) [Tetrahymena thermophila SB210]|uniref:Uncharacterized protein n=1 Tax=Tetrahymena thermophila (strain SB210) TaxID=312017 RepID=Q22T61_TETTS|nr:hypothetical protein TTHERM_00185510 [Tetrahymena thermophila SB210]EAR88577.2 hypothetical protein TTHERM_00185510 [Tetrahymena thermophila SB210]|eukprot:XP_001008822.2 hypothetical protein TTHERM_00185510 [Tetrahymena thermophila SB210]
MQLTSSPYNYKLKDGQQFSSAVKANAKFQDQNYDEGNAKVVLQFKQVNTITQIRKNSNNKKGSEVHKPYQDIDEFEGERNLGNFKKKESQEHNDEITTEKTRFMNILDGQRHPSFSQNQNHTNTLNENSIQKNRLKTDQLNETHLNFQHLNTPKSNQYQSSNNSNVPSQINSHYGSQQAFPDIDCQQQNHNNCKNCIYSNNQSQQSLQQVDTLQEIERRPTNAKHIRSNQTFTTLTTAQNTYPLSQQGHQRAPSISSVSKTSQDHFIMNFYTANLQHLSNQQNNLSTNNNCQSNQQINLPSRNLSFQNQTNYESELDHEMKQMNQTSHNNLDINKSSMNLIQSDRYEKTQVNNDQDKNSSDIIQNQNINYDQQQYYLNSDSSRCNYQFNQYPHQESPLPNNKLPINYFKNKNIGLNTRNNSFSEQQRPEQKKKQKNNSMKDLQIDEASPQQKEKGIKQDQQEVENNDNLNVSFSNLMNDRVFSNQLKNQTNSNQSPLDSNKKLSQSQGFYPQQQNQKKLFNTNLNPQESSNQTHTNSNMLNQSKLMKAFNEFDIKSARSYVNLETNNNQEEHHHHNLPHPPHCSNFEKSQFNKQNMDSINQKQLQIQPRGDMQTNIILKIQENIQTNQALRSNRATNAKDIESKNKEYTNSFCCYPSQGETKHDLEKNSSNNSNNKYLFDNDAVINEKNKKNPNKHKQKCSFQEMKEKCQKALNQINQIDIANSHKEIPQILQEYMKYDDFIKFLINEAQQPLYNSEIDFKVQFQFNSDSFIKNVSREKVKLDIFISSFVFPKQP